MNVITKLKPAIVLSAITTVIGALLLISNGFVPDTSGLITDSLYNKCAGLMGEGEFIIVEDWINAGYKIEKPDEIHKLIKKVNGGLAFEIITNGYEHNGLNILVAMNADGSVKGVEIVSMLETPGIGTKVSNNAFLQKFEGVKEPLTVVVGISASNVHEIQGVTGATFSSKGVTRAVNTAIEIYREMGAVTSE